MLLQRKLATATPSQSNPTFFLSFQDCLYKKKVLDITNILKRPVITFSFFTSATHVDVPRRFPETLFVDKIVVSVTCSSQPLYTAALQQTIPYSAFSFHFFFQFDEHQALTFSSSVLNCSQDGSVVYYYRP